MSIKMMHCHLADRGVPTALVESDTLLVTNDVSGDATPLLNRTFNRVQETLVPLLDEGKVPVVSGYFGVSETSGKLTTLGPWCGPNAMSPKSRL